MGLVAVLFGFLSLISAADSFKSTSQPISLTFLLLLTILVSASPLLVTLWKNRLILLPPGPISWPLFGNLLQVSNDLNHKSLAEMAKKYGHIFLLRMGTKKIVVVSSPELAKEVLHTQGVEFASRTGNMVYDIFTGKGQDMVFTRYGDHWRRMRRIMTVPFCTNRVVQQSRLAWEDEISRFVDDITSRRESFTCGIVIGKRLQLMVYNIIYRMMFDRRFESEEDPLFIKLEAYNTERIRLAQSFDYNYGDFMPILRPFLRGYLNQCKELQDRRHTFFRDCFLEERKKVLNVKEAGKVGYKCAIDRILKDQMNQEIDENNVLYIIENLNVQAIQTTLWSMEWVLAEIINHPEIQDKVREELDTVLGEGVFITQPDVCKLPYLQAVIKESLRLHMPIPLLIPHMNLNPAKLGGYDIPPETKILVNAWWIANNPDLWDNPGEFWPERFLKEEIAVNGSDFRYFPFGSGRRCCPGSILALPLLSLVVGRLVQTYELLPGPGLDQVDMSELAGQSSLHLLNHSVVRVRVRA